MAKRLVTLLLVSGAFANPRTYPEAGKWNYSVSLENGIENNYAYSNDENLSINSLPFTTLYKMRTTQTIGYGKWFYLQSKFAYSLGFTGFNNFSSILKQHDFLDYDLSFIFPIYIPSRFKITLQPQVGFAYLCETLRTRSAGTDYHRRLYYVAPLIGLLLGFEPTERIALRSGLNFQFPRGHGQTLESFSGPGGKLDLRAARHSINFLFSAFFQVSKYFHISTTFESNSFSAYGTRRGESAPDTAENHRSSCTVGGAWTF